MLPTMSLSVELMKTNQRRGTLEAVAGRLQVAMAYRRMTITELQAALEQASVVGSRYSNVQRYVRGKCGKSPPPLHWVEGAAAVLGVSPAWLAFGDDRPSSGLAFTAPQRLRALADEFEGT